MHERGSPKRFVLWLLWAAALFWADQFSKDWILQHYQLGDYTPLTGFFNIVRAHNPGAAFSFLAAAGGWQRWLFTGIAVVVSTGVAVWMARVRPTQYLLLGSLTLVLGGALGNLVDRLRFGYVVDFISVHLGDHYFPAFNVADSAITIGAILLVLDMYLHPHHHSSTEKESK